MGETEATAAPQEMVVEKGAQLPSRSILASRAIAVPILIVVATAALSMSLRVCLLARYPFDGLYGQDSYFYLEATHRLETAWSGPARLWQWVTSVGTPPASVWPLGYHLQMALASIVTGTGAASGQAVSMLAGVAVPVLTVVLFLIMETANEPAPRDLRVPAWAGALTSGLLAGVSVPAVSGSLVVMADMAGLAWALGGVVAFTLYVRSPGRGVSLGLLSGLCLGFASITRYIYPLLLVPIAVQIWLVARRNRAASAKGLAETGRTFLPVLLPTASLVGLQLVHNLIHPMPGLPSPVIANWSPLHAFERAFFGPDGHLTYSVPMVGYYVLGPFLPGGAVGPLPGLMALLGIAAVVRRRYSGLWPLAMTWWGLFALFFSGTIYQSERFVLTYLPPIALLSGAGISGALRWGGEVRSGRAWSRALFAAVAVALAGWGVAALTISSSRSVATLVNVKQDYLQAARCAQDLAGSSLDNPIPPFYTFEVTFTVKQYTDIEPRDLYYETPESLRARLARPVGGTRAYLLAPVSRFERQWAGTNVGADYRELTRYYVLEQVPCLGTSFSLFRVR